ncbi:hypothetical protein SDC9_156695 [bioreactor metagenome]|uniref:Uncharacterized protein n=1 Tax=bioreactor metagenome TaxID=1076179 RepID=A0A645F4Y3_9ZZZZ
MFSVPGFALLGIVHADEQHIDDPLLAEGLVLLRVDRIQQSRLRCCDRRWLARLRRCARSIHGDDANRVLRPVCICKLCAGIQERRIGKHPAHGKEQNPANQQHRPERALFLARMLFFAAHSRRRVDVRGDKRLHIHRIISVFGHILIGRFAAALCLRVCLRARIPLLMFPFAGF